MASFYKSSTQTVFYTLTTAEKNISILLFYQPTESFLSMIMSTEQIIKFIWSYPLFIEKSLVDNEHKCHKLIYTILLNLMLKFGQQIKVHCYLVFVNI